MALALAHLPKFVNDDGNFIAEGLMRRARWITHIPSCRIVVISFGKSAGQHKNFLTTGMLMTREARARRVPHNAGRPSFLASQPVKHHALHTPLEPSHPFVLV